MADYWVSFRINDDSGYDQRYRELTEIIVEASDRKYWDETSSFYLLDTGLDLDTLTRALVAPLTVRDILVVRVLDVKSARYFGAIEREKSLKAFMPYAERFP